MQMDAQRLFEPVMENIKEEARKLIDRLPENSTWDDLMYQFMSGKLLKLDWQIAKLVK